MKLGINDSLETAPWCDGKGANKMMKREKKYQVAESNTMNRVKVVQIN